MHYRILGNTKAALSLLGFSCRRLPLLADGTIDEVRALARIRLALELGINLYDTIRPGGEAETVLGRALAGIRENVFVCAGSDGEEDIAAALDDRLTRLDTPYLDFFCLYGLGRERWARLRAGGALEALAAAKEAGKVRFLGFACHDAHPVFAAIANAFPWDFCQVQFNFLDENFQAGLKGVELAVSRGLGVMATEPLKGGHLARRQPPAVQAVWDGLSVRRSPAEWALRWVWGWGEVTTALSGMVEEDMLRENCHIAGEAVPFSLTDDEREAVARVRALYERDLKVGCTGCGWCLPCPHGVDIPGVFLHYNDAFLYGNKEWARGEYAHLEKGAAACTGCRECEPRCPQQLPIAALMPQVVREMGE
jgi:predicted aldo/keto reductase-like oxidoreductase